MDFIYSILLFRVGNIFMCGESFVDRENHFQSRKFQSMQRFLNHHSQASPECSQ